MTDFIHNILLVGAGQLGSRHLQGLAHISIPVSIIVIDPSEASLKTARERFTEIKSNPNIKDIQFQTTHHKSHECIDLAVIATGADVRADVLDYLITNKQVRNVILEKFLFQKQTDYERIGVLLEKQLVKVFVNCPRRLYPFYRQLKKILSGEGPISFIVDGSQWGMGCNIIHFLDLFAFLTGNHAIGINNVSLDNSILESKRPGFVEFTGTVMGANARGDRFEISSRIEPDKPLRISIISGSQQIEIHESEGRVLFTSTKTGDVQQESFVVSYQSQLTGEIAQEILLTGTCTLTPYTESMHLHLPILKTFLGHLNNVSGRQYDYCPIT